MSEVVGTDAISQFCASTRVFGRADAATATLDAYSIDGLRPGVVVAPRNLAELRGVLSETHNYRLAAVPFGTGSQRGLGNRPERYDVALSLRQLDRVIDHVPADMTVTVEAGATLAQLEATLADHGQFLPLRPATGAGGTVGGMLAANDQGMLRYAFGTARDWLIGMAVVQADGTLARAGGRVVKNVAGYDLGKLFIGSLGTLGVIAEATFKLTPLAAAEITFAAAFASPHAAAMFLLAVRDEALSVHMAEMLSPAAAQRTFGVPRWGALLRIAGGSGAVERSVREVQELADSLRADVISTSGIDATAAWEEAFAPAGIALRCGVLPAQVADAADALVPAEDDRTLLSSTLGAGVIRLRRPAAGEGARDWIASARAVIDDLGGSVIIESAPPDVKAGLDVFGARRADFGIMRRVKEAFDPGRILAPGRFVGGL